MGGGGGQKPVEERGERLFWLDGRIGFNGLRVISIGKSGFKVWIGVLCKGLSRSGFKLFYFKSKDDIRSHCGL